MSEHERAERFEALLARLYTDEKTRLRFLEDPRAFALSAGLDLEQATALASIDRAGLALTAQSLANKRSRR